MPAAGKPFASTAEGSALWLTSDRDRALHRRTAKGWEAVAVPAPPFGSAQRGPVSIESIKMFGADDVFVNTRPDIRALATPVLRHRLVLNFHARADNLDTDTIVERLLKVVKDE